MTRMLASGAASAAALARSRTMEALVLNRSARASVFALLVVCSSASLTVTSHAWLAGHTSRDQDDLTASETVSQARALWVIARNLLQISVSCLSLLVWRSDVRCFWC